MRGPATVAPRASATRAAYLRMDKACSPVCPGRDAGRQSPRKSARGSATLGNTPHRHRNLSPPHHRPQTRNERQTSSSRCPAPPSPNTTMAARASQAKLRLEPIRTTEPSASSPMSLHAGRSWRATTMQATTRSPRSAPCGTNGDHRARSAAPHQLSASGTAAKRRERFGKSACCRFISDHTVGCCRVRISEARRVNSAPSPPWVRTARYCDRCAR